MKYLSLLAGLLLALASCKKTDNNTATNGTLKMYMSDGPLEDTNVAGVYITVKSVSVNVNNTWKDLDNFNGPKVYNLLDLRDSNNVFLGQTTLPAGSYSEIRFILDAPEDTNGNKANPGCYILYKDGTKQSLFVPSGSSSGFKAKGNFDVPANGTVTLLSDFDLRKSIVFTGNNGKVILKPVIRLQAINQAGSIHGTFTNTTSYNQFVIYAYSAGAYADAEAADPASGAVRFPNAVTSSMVSSGNTFSLNYLAPGTYTLVVTGYQNGTYDKVLGYVNNVTVTSGQTTSITVNTGSLSSTH
jgi:hypothetical protein